MNKLKAFCLGALVLLGPATTSFAQTPLEDARAAIAAEAANVQALAVETATTTASNAVTIATAAIVLMVILAILGFIWAFMRGRSVRC